MYWKPLQPPKSPRCGPQHTHHRGPAPCNPLWLAPHTLMGPKAVLCTPQMAVVTPFMIARFSFHACQVPLLPSPLGATRFGRVTRWSQLINCCKLALHIQYTLLMQCQSVKRPWHPSPHLVLWWHPCMPDAGCLPLHHPSPPSHSMGHACIV